MSIALPTNRPVGHHRSKRSAVVHGSTGSDVDVRLVARSIAQAAVEVLAGTRPLQQLSRSLDPECLISLQHRAALTREHNARQKGRRHVHQSPMVRSVRACEISDTIYEASIVVTEELRSRAIAMRLEHCDQTWRVTALEIG
ncbi:Rv3235 family protein [Paenarthrobacter sp. NPDC092416]|uniref:Rv3235 family protein n=1 Tax=Paenarthrobacter sp. NPDC092416 TaxID=3364386 RepID=UPI003824AC87